MVNRVILGTQSLPALYDVYGENASHAMFSAFTNNIITGLNDPVTIEKTCRTLRQKDKNGNTNRGVSNYVTTYNISEEIMAQNDTGEAIISINDIPPFYVKLDP